MPTQRQKAKRKRSSILIIIAVICTGVAGYMVLEKIDFIDALYMTIITLSTVGFREVTELSDGGKIFTIFLVVTSLGAFAYALSLVSTYFVEGQLNAFLRGYIKKSDIKKMKDHVIICGYGRNGRQAVEELTIHKTYALIIDISKEKLETHNEEKYIHFLVGDATKDETLKEAKIERAKALITTLPVDADNLYVALTARSLNPGLKIISRASDEASEKKLRMAGVDSIVMPERVGGAHMAKLVARPDVVEFLEHLTIHGIDPTNLEEISCDNMPEALQNLTIDQIGFKQKSGALIIGFKTPDGKYILNPSSDTKVLSNTKLFVLGTDQQIQRMKDLIRDTNS